MLKTKITISRFDKDHRLLEKREQPSRSWLRHFFDLLYIPLGYNINTLAGINDITPAGRALVNPGGGTGVLPNLMVGAPGGGIATWIPSGSEYNHTCSSTPHGGEDIGIVVGSNATPVTPTDDKLNTRIAHGEAATQLLYGGGEIYGLLFAGLNGEMRIRRYFTNESGGVVTVREIGIYSPGFSVAGLTAYIFCIARDLTLVMGVPTDVVVADTQILEVEYTVQITV